MNSANLGQSQRAKQALLSRKIHLLPDAYRRSPVEVRQQFASGWAAARRLADLLGGLPPNALNWWAAQASGHVRLVGGEAGFAYAEDGIPHGDVWLGAAVEIPLALLARQPDEALAGALLPLDHLLGCGGVAGGQWFSDGGGAGVWQPVGQQIQQLFRLGYGLSPAGRQDPHRYLAEGLATALRDRRRINTADPKLDRLLQSTLLSEGFWARAVAAPARGM